MRTQETLLKPIFRQVVSIVSMIDVIECVRGSTLKMTDLNAGHNRSRPYHIVENDFATTVTLKWTPCLRMINRYFKDIRFVAKGLDLHIRVCPRGRVRTHLQEFYNTHVKS